MDNQNTYSFHLKILDFCSRFLNFSISKNQITKKTVSTSGMGINYFFDLTKLNIIDETSNIHKNQITNKPFLSGKMIMWCIACLLIFLLLINYLAHVHHVEKVVVNTPEKHRLAPSDIQPKLISVIPSFRVLAHHQMLQKVSLLKTDSAFAYEEGDDLVTPNTVVDKVLVVPKRFVD